MPAQRDAVDTLAASRGGAAQRLGATKGQGTGELDGALEARLVESVKNRKAVLHPAAAGCGRPSA